MNATDILAANNDDDYKFLGSGKRWIIGIILFICLIAIILSMAGLIIININPPDPSPPPPAPQPALSDAAYIRIITGAEISAIVFGIIIIVAVFSYYLNIRIVRTGEDGFKYDGQNGGACFKNSKCLEKCESSNGLKDLGIGAVSLIN